MTLGGLHPFIKAAVESVGLKEWKDGFNVQNIPASILNGSFHVAVGQISAENANQLVHNFRAPVKVNLFFKGYRDPQSAKDAALDKGQEVLNALLKPTVRLASEGLKDIRPVSIQPLPIDGSNDNSLILELVFECFLIYRFT